MILLLFFESFAPFKSTKKHSSLPLQIDLSTRWVNEGDQFFLFSNFGYPNSPEFIFTETYDASNISETYFMVCSRLLSNQK